MAVGYILAAVAVDVVIDVVVLGFALLLLLLLVLLLLVLLLLLLLLFPNSIDLILAPCCPLSCLGTYSASGSLLLALILSISHEGCT